VAQPQGYVAFVPAPLPPDPPLVFDAELRKLLSEADQAVGRLDGVAQLLPNPDLYVAMYVRREAVLSSQIEGTQSTLEDVLNFELGGGQVGLPDDVEEVVNYVLALNHGLRRLPEIPVSRRLIRELHARLLSTGRGSRKQPGEFRTTQNWIGGDSTRIEDASFVPPPPAEMDAALDDLERFLNDGADLPVLVHAALAHAQFETIHPFLDGNGRVGRLLITLLLVHRGILDKPLLYLSYYLKQHRLEYYDRLTAVRRDGDWEGWLRFFLRGVAETATEATRLARQIVAMREEHRSVLQTAGVSGRAFDLLDVLFAQPLVNVNVVAERLNVSFGGARKLVERFVEAGFLVETTGQQRNRRFAYQPYLDLLNR
jgi:Fic family protein